MLSQKCVQIITYICRQADGDEFVRIDDLAKKNNVSERTIRYDLDKIDAFLKEHSFNELLREKGAGVRINEPPENIERIMQALHTSNMRDYIMTKKERIVFIVMLLFGTQGFIKYEELAEELFVSRKTIIEDVRSLKENISKGSVKSTKYGISFDIGESEKRIVLMNHLLSILTPLELYRISGGKLPNISIAIERKWRELIDGHFVNECEKALRETEKSGNRVLTDDYYYLLVILTVLALLRINQGQGADGEDCSEQDSFLKVFFNRVEESFNTELNSCERRLIQTEVERILQMNGNERIAMKAELITEQFIVRVSELVGEKYYQDNILRKSLNQHFENVLRQGGRAKASDLPLEKYRAKHESLYNGINKLLREICAFDTIEDNADLIMLHFLAASERRRGNEDVKFRAIVVCLNGIGSAKMLSAGITKHFPEVDVIDAISLRRIDDLAEKEKPDFILSTVPLEIKDSVVIEVSPVLNDGDIERIRSLIQSQERARAGKPASAYDRLMKAIVETCEIKDNEELERQIKSILRIKDENKQLRLKDLLTDKTVQIGVIASDWKDAVRKSAEPLMDAGFIKESYIDAMIKNIDIMGPYIIIMPGIALPHALPEDGVIKSCISLTLLKSGVSFERTSKGPVKLLFTFASRDGSEHMNVLSELMCVINDKSLIDSIMAADEKEEVLRLISLV